MKTVDYLFEQSGLAIEDVAERAGLPLERVEAIVVGRWLPSPKERQKIAEAFGAAVEDISWGHTMDPRNIRYRRHGFRE
ncbi:MAG: helix-turn-helix transcriptional regulator [Pirellulaceae bacterium]